MTWHHRAGLTVGEEGGLLRPQWDLFELSFLQHGRQVPRELEPGQRQNHKGGGAMIEVGSGERCGSFSGWVTAEAQQAKAVLLPSSPTLPRAPSPFWPSLV